MLFRLKNIKIFLISIFITLNHIPVLFPCSPAIDGSSISFNQTEQKNDILNKSLEEKANSQTDLKPKTISKIKQIDQLLDKIEDYFSNNKLPLNYQNTEDLELINFKLLFSDLKNMLPQNTQLKLDKTLMIQNVEAGKLNLNQKKKKDNLAFLSQDDEVKSLVSEDMGVQTYDFSHSYFQKYFLQQFLLKIIKYKETHIFFKQNPQFKNIFFGGQFLEQLRKALSHPLKIKENDRESIFEYIIQKKYIVYNIKTDEESIDISLKFYLYPKLLINSQEKKGQDLAKYIYKAMKNEKFKTIFTPLMDLLKKDYKNKGFKFKDPSQVDLGMGAYIFFLGKDLFKAILEKYKAKKTLENAAKKTQTNIPNLIYLKSQESIDYLMESIKLASSNDKLAIATWDKIMSYLIKDMNRLKSDISKEMEKNKNFLNDFKLLFASKGKERYYYWENLQLNEHLQKIVDSNENTNGNKKVYLIYQGLRSALIGGVLSSLANENSLESVFAQLFLVHYLEPALTQNIEANEYRKNEIIYFQLNKYENIEKLYKKKFKTLTGKNDILLDDLERKWVLTLLKNHLRNNSFKMPVFFNKLSLDTSLNEYEYENIWNHDLEYDYINDFLDMASPFNLLQFIPHIEDSENSFSLLSQLIDEQDFPNDENMAAYYSDGNLALLNPTNFIHIDDGGMITKVYLKESSKLDSINIIISTSRLLENVSQDFENDFSSPLLNNKESLKLMLQNTGIGLFNPIP